jgi:hypothetical protein
LKKDEFPENEPKPKRKRPNEVIDVLKNFMETQQKDMMTKLRGRNRCTRDLANIRICKTKQGSE